MSGAVRRRNLMLNDVLRIVTPLIGLSASPPFPSLPRTEYFFQGREAGESNQAQNGSTSGGQAWGTSGETPAGTDNSVSQT